jgi:hypothetical protein
MAGNSFGQPDSQLPARIAAALAAIAMAGVPLLIAPGLTLEYETTPKLVLLLVSTAGLLLCYRGWWPGAVALFETRRGRLFAGIFAAQFLSLVAATALSSQPALSLAGSSWRRYGLVTQLALGLFSLTIAALAAAHTEYLRKILLAIAGSSGVIAIYGIAQSAGFDPLLPRASYIITYWNGELARGPGTLGHAVYLGGFLAAAVPITVGLATEAKGIGKLTLWGIVALSLVATVLSGSRSSLLALCAAAAVSLPAIRRIRGRTAWGAAAICAAGAVALVFFLSLHSGSSLRLHVDRWRQDLYGGPRVRVWRESLALVAAYPIAGSGPETFGNQFRRRQSAELSRAYPDYFQESPHNFLLEGAIAQGCFFFVIVAGIVYLVMAGRAASNRGPAVWLRASMVATLVSLLFLPVTISGALMLYGILGLLVAVTATAGVQPRGAVPGLVKLAACGLAALLLAAGIAYLRKDMAYTGIDAAVKAHRFAEMAHAYRTMADGLFPGPGDDLWASRQFAAIARELDPQTAAEAWALAAEAAAMAERTSDDQADAAYQSALVAISTNHAEQAESKLRMSIERAPTWYKSHLLLAQLLHFTGHDAESKTEAKAALDFAGSRRPGVEQALSQLGL